MEIRHQHDKCYQTTFLLLHKNIGTLFLLVIGTFPYFRTTQLQFAPLKTWYSFNEEHSNSNLVPLHWNPLHFQLQLTLEQHGLELCRSTYIQVFSH